jgi:hypothetical protein
MDQLQLPLEKEIDEIGPTPAENTPHHPSGIPSSTPVSGATSPKTTNENFYSAKHNRWQILYNLDKELKYKRFEMHQKGILEKEIKELSDCTFSPKINLKDAISDEASAMHISEIEKIPNSLHQSSFNSYVDRVRKNRVKNKEVEDEYNKRIGSGNKWKAKVVTVPCNFQISKGNYRQKNHSFNYAHTKQASMSNYNLAIQPPNNIDIKVSNSSLYN